MASERCSSEEFFVRGSSKSLGADDGFDIWKSSLSSVGFKSSRSLGEKDSILEDSGVFLKLLNEDSNLQVSGFLESSNSMF